jgi:beta-glucosidase
VSTASYQIEGAVAEDGRRPSIWDTFTHQPGRVRDGSTGDVTCDHYHRWAEDVALLGELGVGAYRFSIAWPRVQPTGDGPANPAGLAFYDRLIDALLERGIDPVATLFHWDLPEALQAAGGWQVRDTAARFGEYAELVAESLGDRVKLWVTLNEPFIHFSLGHVLGIHAPGLTLPADQMPADQLPADQLPAHQMPAHQMPAHQMPAHQMPADQMPADQFPVVHHQLLGHGLAVAALRRASKSPITIANNYSPVWPVGSDGTRESATEVDHAGAMFYDMVQNWLFTDPILRGEYPPGFEALSSVDVDATILDGDLTVIAAPIDALGVNYYNPTAVSGPAPGEALPFTRQEVRGYPRTGFDWPVVPDGLRDMLVQLKDRYGDGLPPIWITESGCAYPETVNADGSVDDPERVAYYDGHIKAVAAAIEAGVRVDGYCAWSLLDNFEWAEGFTQRFGLVHVDFATQRRTPKTSFRWYRDHVRSLSS